MRVKYWKKICDFSKNKEQFIPDPASNFPVLYSLFIKSGFQVGVVSPNPKYISQPNTTNTNFPMNQSQLEAITL